MLMIKDEYVFLCTSGASGGRSFAKNLDGLCNWLSSILLSHSITDELHPDEADDNLLVVFRKPIFILFHSSGVFIPIPPLVGVVEACHQIGVAGGERRQR
uniref:Uncharacterized protein n=1 Tax=Nelumbo nucifera TaxID=4432 RepID=A0A822XXB7_NELNU|nr:TPA_asm: hypothetical protein HUJ06_024878 [Nelumbo nucifera]